MYTVEQKDTSKRDGSDINLSKERDFVKKLFWIILFLSTNASAQSVPEPTFEGWKNLSQEQKAALSDIANSAHAVYSKGVQKYFQSGFKACEKGVADALNGEIKNIRANVQNLNSKKEVAEKLAEADQLSKTIEFVTRVHCLSRAMIAVASTKSGVVSPVIDEWMQETKNFQYDDLTQTAIKQINEQIGKKHENFIQGDIQMLKLTDEERRNLKKRLKLSDGDIAAAGSVRFQRYLTSYNAMYNTLNAYFVDSAKEFGCKLNKSGDKPILCE
jgi:hypothetical protein